MPKHVEGPDDVEQEGHNAEDDRVPGQWKVRLFPMQHPAGDVWWILRDALSVPGRLVSDALRENKIHGVRW